MTGTVQAIVEKLLSLPNEYEYNARTCREAAALLLSLQADSERYAWLKAHYYAADFFYPDVGSVLIFDMGSQEHRVSPDLDATIDAARSGHE